jgi:hypothetical protein
MPRTTLDLDASALAELRQLAQREGKSMGQIASEVLVSSLAERRVGANAPPPLTWISRDLGAPKVDLEDKEAVRLALERSR